MKLFVISDNVDTQIGMRLSGIDGVVVHDKESASLELENVMNRDDIAVVLMTENVIRLIKDLVYDYKLNQKTPLIIEIPDRHGNGRTKDSITKYVEEAIGVKID